MRISEELRNKKMVVELRRVADRDFHSLGPRLFQSKTEDELRLIARELGLERWDQMDKQGLAAEIGSSIRELGGHRYIRGRLAILADGSGVLCDVHPGNEVGRPRDEEDHCGVFVPSFLIQWSQLKEGDTVSGVRRWPYEGEEYLVLVTVDDVARAEGAAVAAQPAAPSAVPASPAPTATSHNQMLTQQILNQTYMDSQNRLRNAQADLLVSMSGGGLRKRYTII
jgi:transcription termination factor Rho